MNATAAYGFYMSRRPGLGALSGKMGTSMLRLSVALEPVNGLRKTKSPYSRSAKIIPRAKLKNSGKWYLQRNNGIYTLEEKN